MKRILLLSLYLFFLVGCADPKLDASSAEAFEESMVKMIEPLPEERRELLADAMVVLLLSGGAQAGADGPVTEGLPPALTGLHGMSSEEIIGLAEMVLEAREFPAASEAQRQAEEQPGSE